MSWRSVGIRITLRPRVIYRKYTTESQSQLSQIPKLQDWDISRLRSATKELSVPVVLPRVQSHILPASKRWFLNPETADECKLNDNYLHKFGDIHVPLELTSSSGAGHVEFRRTHAPLSLFLRWTREAPPEINQRIYLAQCQLMDLPDELKRDIPTPEIVFKAGRGDIYDSNIWIGRAPTYTPLHRDPNPNFFHQLAGKKVVRIFPPDVGDRIYRQMRKEVDSSRTSSSSSSSSSSAQIRGEEMMAGAERVKLEERIWSDDNLNRLAEDDGCQEAVLEYGETLFIPLKWWHSIKGLGNGVTASVNWWFR